MEKENFIDPDKLKRIYAVTSKEDVRYNFTQDEILELKNEVFIISNHKINRDNLKESINDLIKDDTDHDNLLVAIHQLLDDTQDLGNLGFKMLKVRFSALINQINKGYKIENQLLYGIDNQEDGKMYFYGESGNFIYSRPLTQMERQTNIHSIKYKAV